MPATSSAPDAHFVHSFRDFIFHPMTRRAISARPYGGVPITEAFPAGKQSSWAVPRLAGLVLLRAPLPLMQALSQKAAAAIGDCTCGANFQAGV